MTGLTETRSLFIPNDPAAAKRNAGSMTAHYAEAEAHAHVR